MHSHISSVSNWSVPPPLIYRQGNVLRVTAFNEPPYMEVQEREDGTLAYGGLLYDIWLILAAQLSLTYRIVPHNGTSYGFLQPDGTWDGLVGEVVYNRADVALSWFLMRNDRGAVVDFVDKVPLAADVYTFFVRKIPVKLHETSTSVFRSLLRPLHVHVWLTLAIVLLLMSLVLRLILRGRDRRASELEAPSWVWCLLVSFMTVVNQGWARTPNGLSARIVTLVGWMLGIILQCTFTANLISHLTVTTETKPINGLHALYRQPKWTLAGRHGTASWFEWKASDSIYEQDLYRRASENAGFIGILPSGENINRVLEPQVVFHGGEWELYFAIGDEACSFVPLFDVPPPRMEGYMVIAQGLPELKRRLNTALLRLVQAGVMARLERRWLGDRQKCAARAGATFAPLTVRDVMPLLALATYGVICGVLLAMLEWVASRATLFAIVAQQSV